MMIGQVNTHNVVGNGLGLISVATAWAGVWFSAIPILLASAASAVAVVYYLLQVYKDPSFQAWRIRRAMRRLDKLRIKMRLLEIRSGLSPAVVQETARLREKYTRVQHEEVEEKVHLLEQAKKEEAKPVT